MQAGMDSWGRMRGASWNCQCCSDEKYQMLCLSVSVSACSERHRSASALPVTHSNDTLQSRSFTGLVLEQIALNHFSFSLFFVF